MRSLEADLEGSEMWEALEKGRGRELRGSFTVTEIRVRIEIVQGLSRQ